MKKNYLVVLLVLLAILFTSCATTTKISTYESKSALRKGEWGTPETHTLLFGINGGDIKTSSVLLQQNPDIGYDFFYPYSISTPIYILNIIPIGEYRFFIFPLPTGAEIKETSWTEYVGRSKFVINDGIAGVDITLTKPGLQFYGEDNEQHTQELKTLKKIVKYFKGSDWETVIRARIEEISNAK